MPKYTFSVAMTCSGCSNAVTKALNKIEGVENVDANLETQKVVVDTTNEVEGKTVLDAIKKTGKQVDDNYTTV
ncbi:heavy metal-associated domain-containing protein [Parasitella parasitica]|nr:heavy metal-associated domain-containing protein [Parasitella parasitica]